MKIAVYGSASGDMDEETQWKAEIVGEEIAKRGHTLITGGCPGYPFSAVKGARGKGGRIIGYSPAVDLDAHINMYKYPHKEFDELVFIPKDYTHKDNIPVSLKYRNVSSAADCDACVIIGGRTGTLNEFTVAYDSSKIVGVLTGTGGTADLIKDLRHILREDRGSLFFDDNPKALVEAISDDS